MLRYLKILLQCWVVMATSDDQGWFECREETPEFSHVTGSPDISTIADNDRGVTGVRISWSVDQLLYGQVNTVL